jgi:hypothetical protein
MNISSDSRRFVEYNIGTVIRLDLKLAGSRAQFFMKEEQGIMPNVSSIEMCKWEYLYLKRGLGLTDPEIAELKHTSTAALSRWKSREGVKAARTVEEFDMLRMLGRSYKEIQEIWNINQSALYLWRKKYDRLQDT